MSFVSLDGSAAEHQWDTPVDAVQAVVHFLYRRSLQQATYMEFKQALLA